MSRRPRPWLPLTLLALATLACSQLGPQPTVQPPPASATASPSPGPETPTPRPETLTQPAAATDETAIALPTAAAGTPLPPLTADVFVRVAAIGGEVPGTVLDLTFTPDGTLWLLTDQTVVRLAGETWEVYLPEYDGELAGVDDLGRVWVAAADGTAMAAWDGTEWRSFGAGAGWAPAPPGPAGSAVQRGIIGDQLGRVWVATSQDVRAFDGEQWQVFDRVALGMPAAAAGETSPHFTIHVARRDGVVWVSECDHLPPGPSGGGGVRWHDGAAWQGAGAPVDAGCGGAVASSASGQVWVGLDDAVLAYDPDSGEWTTYAAPAPPAGERFGQVSDLALDSFEQAWPLLTICGGASCEVGQVRYQIGVDGTWTQVGEVSDAQSALLFDIGGSGWLLSQAGVQRASDGQVQPAGEMRVLASTTDGSGQIFVAGEQAGELALWLIRPGNE